MARRAALFGAGAGGLAALWLGSQTATGHAQVQALAARFHALAAPTPALPPHSVR